MRRIRIFALAGLALLAACQDSLAPRPDQPVHTGPAEGTVTSGEVRRGWIFGPGGTPMEVGFEVRDGRAVMEGDIYLGPADAIPASREELLRPAGPRFGVIQDGSIRWPQPVPYTISSSFSAGERQTILDAMAHIRANNAGVSFIQRTYQSSYVAFVPHGEVCESPIGRQGGKQEIKLADGCASSRGRVVHEILHSLGMWHEHSRCDRDTYVEILWNNILDDKKHNFHLKCSGATDVGAYDEGSLMHYPPYAFTKNNLPTIRSRRGRDSQMGQRFAMSASDVYTVHWLYAPPVVVTGVTYPNGVPAITWNPSPTAMRYEINLVVDEYFRDPYEYRTGSSSTPVGSTGATTFYDYSNRFTGVDICDYSGASYTHEFFYKYEVVAVFPSGARRAGVGEARVARC
jgi:astacin